MITLEMRGRILDEINRLQNSFGQGPSRDGAIAERIEMLKKEAVVKGVFITRPQYVALRGTNALGVIEVPGRNGFRKSNWTRMMKRLAVAGLVKPYVHGGFEITPDGIAARQP